MKHTKKMIMVPEGEYLTLLGMIKNNDDYLTKEKIDKEIKMAKVLRNPKLTEFEKGRKYDWLYKQRRQLKHEIENEAEKPKKVLIDPKQLGLIKSDIAKYLGVSPISNIQQQEQKPQKQTRSRKFSRHQSIPTTIRLNSQLKTTSKDIAPFFLSQQQQEKPSISKRVEEKSIESEQYNTDEENQSQNIPKYIIYPNYYKDMLKIMKQNRIKLRLDNKGEIFNDEGKPIIGSNYVDVLDYLTGKIEEKPLGTDELFKRMEKEKYFNTAKEYAEWHRQRGEGKSNHINKILLKTLLYTKGLVRVPNKKLNKSNFKPIIWQKL